MRTLIAGNWKMNGLKASLVEIQAMVDGIGEGKAEVDALICPPATLIAAAVDLASGSALQIGGQNCHAGMSGAHTGDVSAAMLKDAGASHIILGHSERRTDHGELSAEIKDRVLAVFDAGLTPIVCIGESLSDREAGLTEKVVLGQLEASLPREAADKSFVVAYEPIWAIGTGHTATPDQIGEVHKAIRGALATRFGEAGKSAPILYGGSMKPGNAAEILAVEDVNGGLIGGASLKAADFLAIYEAAL
ncbi:MAG: triose-phosphate isomerase [Pseudomonadota bacterium]